MIANESYVNKLSLLLRRSKLSVVQTLYPSKESVLELTTASVGHQRLNMLPLLSMLIDQRDQVQVFLQGPFFRVEVRLKEVLIVVLELLESAIGKKSD